MSLDTYSNQTGLKTETFAYRFPYIFGSLYILLGLITFLEGGSPSRLFWYSIVQLLYGLLYLLVGYFITKGSIKALWLLTFLVITHSILYDVYLEIVAHNRNVNLQGLLLSSVWVIYVLVVMWTERQGLEK